MNLVLRFGLGEVAVRGQVAGPGEQVDGEGDDLAPGRLRHSTGGDQLNGLGGRGGRSRR